MDTETIARSHTVRIVILTIAGIVVLLGIFQLGMFVGFKKAAFSFRFGQQYHQMFGGPKQGFFGDMEGRDLMNAHGVYGSVMQVDGDTLIIKGKDQTEKDVVVTTTTSIRRNRNMMRVSDVQVNDPIVVIGSPNDQGQIEAKFIRVFPTSTPL